MMMKMTPMKKSLTNIVISNWQNPNMPYKLLLINPSYISKENFQFEELNQIHEFCRHYSQSVERVTIYVGLLFRDVYTIIPIEIIPTAS